MKNAIYIAIDNNFERYARACFNSIEKNYPNHPDILIFTHEKLNEKFETYINTLNNFYIKQFPKKETFENLGPVGNSIVYDKYILWTDIFDEYENILHLDADILVLKPLDDLFNYGEFTIFNNNEILESVNILNNFPIDIELKYEIIKRINDKNISFKLLNNEKIKMCNGGVFLIPKKYRTEKNYNELIDITIRYNNNLQYADQSAITLWCYFNNIDISDNIEFNFQPHFFNYENNKYELDDIYIIHFASKKPDTLGFILWWRLHNLSLDFNKLYNDYLER